MTRRKPVSVRLLIEGIDKADIHFQWCWEFLRGAQHQRISQQALFDFQVRLTTAFAGLDETYRTIKAEEKRLIGRKSRYDTAWFARRMAQLAQYRAVVVEAIGIGRSLGDGFAWIFYRDEPALLEQHAKHQRQLLLPPGVGGIGERVFIKNLQGLGGQFVIYHGITSFLRLGDVSFFDQRSGNVTCVGELKTQHLGGDRYQITVGIVAGDESSLTMTSAAAAKTKISLPVDKALQNKLDRQIEQIGDAFSHREKSKGDPRIEMGTRFHYDILADVVRGSGTRVARFRQAGPSLTIGAWRPRKISSLGQRLIRKTAPGEKALDPVRDAATAIMSADLDDNCLFVSDIGNHTSGFPPMLTGTEPLIWWPLNGRLLHDIIFGHVIVLTAFNPAHLWCALRKRGYVVAVDNSFNVTSIHKEINGRRMEVENFGYFQQAVQHGLLVEEAALRLFDALSDYAVTSSGAGAVKVGLRPRLHGQHRFSQ